MSLDSTRWSGNGPPFDPSAVPDTVVLKAGRGRLALTWPGGECAEVSAARLRTACRCAWCTRARIDNSFAASFDGVAIDTITPVGDYAINIAFSDGHARGIYPWPYLRTLACEPDGAADAPMPGAPLHEGSPA